MPRVIVWYDGECPLCAREIALMRRLDRGRAIDFVAIEGMADGRCPVDRGELLRRFHADEGGKIVSGAAAFAAMWRAIPLLWPLGLVARNRHVLAMLERIYLWYLARLRPVLHRRLGVRR